MDSRASTTLCAAALSLAVFLPPAPAAAETATAVSLRQIAPTEATVALAWQRNPEQDYQREHLQEVVKTFQQERIAQRVFEIIKSRVKADDLDEARQGLNKFKAAVEPAPLDAIFDASEFCYCQTMEGQMANHLIAVRMTPDAVQGYLQAVKNLLAIAKQESGQDLEVAEEQVDGATYLTLYPPQGVPMQPTVVAKDDVLIFSTTHALARSAVLSLNSQDAKSKFDEPRVAAALAKLPEPEDTVVVYDGKQQMASMKRQLQPLIEAIEIQAQGDPQANAAVKLINAFMKEVDVMDLEVTVGYTEAGQNHTESLGILQPGTEGRLLSMIVEGGKPFDDWSSWVPADAVNYRLSSGVNLHELYTRAMNLFSREAPELAAEALIQISDLEQQFGVQLEDDLLSLFSGESVSLTLPGGQSVMAMACAQPEHTKELLHRAIALAQTIPQVQAQQLELVQSDTLEGFEDLRASFFAALGARPVIGFKEGWMIVATTPEAAQSLIDTRWGDAPDVSSTEGFERFGMKIDGPVSGITYSNTSENIRQAAQYINQAAAMAPLLLGAMMAEADPQDVQTVQQAIGLLPSIARVIEKFDFMEASLAVVQPDSEHGQYRKQSVMLIRQD